MQCGVLKKNIDDGELSVTYRVVSLDMICMVWTTCTREISCTAVPTLQEVLDDRRQVTDDRRKIGHGTSIFDTEFIDASFLVRVGSG